MVSHYTLSLDPRPRGFHVITSEILSVVQNLPEQGILHIYIKHTSAGLCINEAADPDVLIDFECIFNKIVPENMPFLVHTLEGPDDMPAHIKSALVGSSISIPIINATVGFGYLARHLPLRIQKQRGFKKTNHQYI